MATIRGWPPSCSRSLLPLFQWASDEWNSSTCNPPNIQPLVGPRPAPPLPLGKRPPSLLPSSQAKEKGKPIQTLDGRTNHNLSDPYIPHLLLIPIHRRPSSPHICHLLSSHLWYGCLEIEIWYTFNFTRLLFPSWLIYPNNSLKAFVHFLELGQFVCNSSLNFFLDIDFHYRNQMANLSHVYWRSAWGVGGELCTEVPSSVFLGTKFCIVVIFFFKMKINFLLFEKNIYEKWDILGTVHQMSNFLLL